MNPNRFDTFSKLFADHHTRRGVVAGGLGLTGALLGNRALAQDATPESTEPPITRIVLGRGFPPIAEGQVLELMRVTVPVGAFVPAHTHPGTQVGWVESGQMTYTIIEGEAPITRGDANGMPGPEEILRAGDSAALGPGDTVIEMPEMVHEIRNEGDEPIVVFVAALLTEDYPNAEDVTPSASPTS